MYKKDIIIAGVGGQGILSIANVLGLAGISAGMYVKQSEVHGMSQRGGAVQSHLRLSENPVFSDLIPMNSADIILSVEPMEALRYLPYLSANGIVVTNSEPFVNIPGYPPAENIFNTIRALPSYRLINAQQLARESGNSRTTNMVMLGAVSHFIGLQAELLSGAVSTIFSTKGDKVVAQNLAAFEAGRNAAR